MTVIKWLKRLHLLMCERVADDDISFFKITFYSMIYTHPKFWKRSQKEIWASRLERRLYPHLRSAHLINFFTQGERRRAVTRAQAEWNPWLGT